MYPIEYRWMRVPTPVMNRHMVMANGSTSSPASTEKLPDSTQVNSFCTWKRSSPSSPMSPT